MFNSSKQRKFTLLWMLLMSCIYLWFDDFRQTVDRTERPNSSSWNLDVHYSMPNAWLNIHHRCRKIMKMLSVYCLSERFSNDAITSPSHDFFDQIQNLKELPLVEIFFSSHEFRDKPQFYVLEGRIVIF
ncbi:hypothetical protein QYF36_027048 [Acer negundo]|nr:hypothetical protein QYF36_027048 [Acer negundo]